MAIDNNPALLAYRQIESIISTNVQDINANRRAGNGQWIFPEIPEGLDENYPRITIKLESVKFEEHGSGRWFETTYDTGVAVSDTYGNWVHLSFNIIIFVKRKQKHVVRLAGDSVDKEVKNNLQCVHLQNTIAKQLYKSRDTFISQGFNDIIIGDNTSPYEDGEDFWAAEIPVNIITANIWGDEYDESTIIADYELDITAERES